MPDEEKKLDASTPEPTPTADPEKTNDKPAVTFDETYVKELRSENAKWRTNTRELERRLEAMEAAQKQKEETELAEQQKWQQLAEKRAQELEKAQAQIKAVQLQVERVKIAAEFGLTITLDDETGETLADRLRGETPDELRADALKLAKLAKMVQPAPAPAPEGADPKTEPDPAAPPEPARRPATTTAIPGGKPVGRTDADRRGEYFRQAHSSPIFEGGGFSISAKSDES